MSQPKKRPDADKKAREDAAQQNFVDQIWNLLKSMKFAIILLLIWTAASILNLFANEFIVPVRGGSQAAWQTYIQNYGELRASILMFFQMYSPYTSWWYVLMLAVILLSLVVCVIDRAPQTWRRSFKVRLPKDETVARAMPLTGQLPAEAFDAATAYLKKKRYSISRDGETGSRRFEARRHSFAHVGQWLVHIGLVLLVLGGALIARGGLSESAAGLPGEYLQGIGNYAGQEVTWGFKVRVDDFVIEYHPLSEGQYVQIDDSRTIGRIIRENDDGSFDVEVYTPQQGRRNHVPAERLSNRIDRRMQGGRLDQPNISDYLATLTVIENGQEVKTETIEVNAPMRYKGYRFYQSSFNDTRTDEQGRWTTIINVRRDKGAPFVWTGIVLVSLGLLLGMYFIPRRIVGVESAGSLLVGAWTRRNNSLFADFFEDFLGASQGGEKNAS